MKSKLVVCLLALAALAGTAAAAPITFTISMLGAGTLNGVNFTATTVSFTFTSDTAAIVTAGAGIFVTPPDIPGTYSILGVASGNITEPGLHVYDNNGATDAGFSANVGDFIQMIDAAFGGYDLQSNFTSPVVTSPSLTAAGGYSTDGGQLILTSARSGVFSAVVTPEPGTFAFLGGGLALMVAAYRRRKR